jgi:parallel beta-helix repeat protein
VKAVKKKAVYPVFLVSVLIIVLGGIRNVPHVMAAGTIYIRTDGLVYPSDAPIHRDGSVYTLTGNISDSIVIQRDNVVIDGAAMYSLEGPGDYDSIGLDVTSRFNVTVRNFKDIRSFGYGILLNLSSNIVIYGNTVTANNGGGILLSEVTDSVLYGNNMTTNNNYDVKLRYSSHNEIHDNHPRRILLEWNSNNNRIFDNRITVSGQEGIGLGWSADNNTISGNHIQGGLYGVHVFYASNQSIIGNTISETRYGLHLTDSSQNFISRNLVTNVTTAIFLASSSENTIFHNTFMDFEHDAFVFDSHINLWDYSHPNGGNYWSNYSGADSNHDGIGDSSHILDPENRDNYPLMGPFARFNTSAGRYVNIISNSTVDGFEYEASGSIRFYVSNMTANQTHGFCRVRIPYEMVSTPFNVTVDGTTPTYWNYTLYDNGTHRWIYFEYEHSKREVLIIPDSLTLFILPLFMSLTLLAVLAHNRQYPRIRSCSEDE